MSRIFNLRDDELAEAPRAAREGHRFRRTQLTLVHGSKLTGLSVYELSPGEAAWAYHYELNREEWLIVVSGEVVLRSPARRLFGRRALSALRAEPALARLDVTRRQTKVTRVWRSVHRRPPPPFRPGLCRFPPSYGVAKPRCRECEISSAAPGGASP